LGTGHNARHREANLPMASLIAWSPEGIRTSTSTTPEGERPGIRWANGLLSPSSPFKGGDPFVGGADGI
jgi:hypothetical protein